MPKLCVISDTHRLHRELRIPPCELLIHCGDFCSFQKNDIETLTDADEWFTQCPAKQVICVAGNHDYALQDKEFSFKHAHFLEDRAIEIDGLSYYGSPWCPDLPGFAYHAEESELIEHWRRIPSGIDILITHTPAYGVLDVPSAGNIHLGCRHLRDELERIQPKVHLFGHVHAGHGTHQGATTRSFNAAVVGGPDFQVAHSATILELP